MAKYTITNNTGYILFDGVVGTIYEGEQIAFRKSSVKQVRVTVAIDAIHLVHLDDTDSPFRYYDLINPNTGLPFVNLATCKALLLLWLNELASTSDIFLGKWNANTNSPILYDYGYWNNLGTITKASAKSYFIVTTAGNTTIDGTTGWVVGDYVKSDGATWIKIPSASTIPAVNVFFDNTGIADPAWVVIDNVQEAINQLESAAVKSINDLDDVDTTIPTVDKSVLTYNIGTHQWESVVPKGGRTLVNALAIIDGSDEVLPAYGDGIYVLDLNTSASWVPALAGIGDILERIGNGFTILVDMSSESGGAYEVQYSAGKFANSNYVWDGTVWSAIDAYEPNAALLSINVSNPIGDIISSLNGADLKSRSISSLLDDILFQTIYTAPIVPTVSLTGTANIERGSDILGTSVVTYIQNGGGNVSVYNIDAVLDNVIQNTQTGFGPAIPNVDRQNINGYAMKASVLVNNTAKIDYGVTYLQGQIPLDNKGVPHPADQIPAASTSGSAVWTSKFPIWYGSSVNKYSVADANLTNLAITPTIIESDIRALINTSLFTANVILIDVINSGDVTVLVALPPGITMINSELNVAGVWADYSDLRTHFIIVPILAADGTTAKSYKVYYTRSIAANSFSTTQNYRFTTTGAVIP